MLIRWVIVLCCLCTQGAGASIKLRQLLACEQMQSPATGLLDLDCYGAALGAGATGSCRCLIWVIHRQSVYGEGLYRRPFCCGTILLKYRHLLNLHSLLSG